MENYHQNMDDPYQQIGTPEQSRAYTPKFDRETGRPIFSESGYRPVLPEVNSEFRSKAPEPRQPWWSFIITEIIFSNIGLWIALTMCFLPVPMSSSGSSAGESTNIAGHDLFNLAMIAGTVYGILSNSLQGLRNRRFDQLPNRMTGSRSPGKVMNVLFGLAGVIAIWAYWPTWRDWFLTMQNYDFVIHNNNFLTLLVSFTMLVSTMTGCLLLVTTRIKSRRNSQGAWYKIAAWCLLALTVVSCLQFLWLLIAGLSGSLMPYAGNPIGDFINIIYWLIVYIGLFIQALSYTRTRYGSRGRVMG